MPDVALPPRTPTSGRTKPGRHGARSRTHELRWRLIRDGARPGAENMALDHALAACLGEGEAVVRLYGWSRPTVSFGKNERAFEVEEGGVDYVRRPTGGRAVLHDVELTYAVVAPVEAFGGLRAAYRSVNEALAEAMRTLGAAVDVAGDGPGAAWTRSRAGNTGGSPSVERRGPGAGRTAGLDAGPCFRTPAAGEIVAAGRKLVGSAQARLEGALLQHGSILLDGDQSLLLGADRAEETGDGGGAGAEPVTLSELLGEVSLERVADAAAQALRARFGGAWREAEYDARELEGAARLERERYGRDTWTWRR